MCEDCGFGAGCAMWEDDGLEAGFAVCEDDGFGAGTALCEYFRVNTWASATRTYEFRTVAFRCYDLFPYEAMRQM